MRRSKLRSAWGLALAVLFGGSMARAEPPAPPPPGPPTPVVFEDSKPSALPPMGAAPANLPPPPSPPSGTSAGDHGAQQSWPAPPTPGGPAADSHGAGASTGTGHGTGTGTDHGAGNSHGAGNGHGSGEGHGEAAHEEEDFNKIFFSTEYLLIRPRRREQDYAVVGANPNWGPVGVIKNLDGGFDSGGRFGVGYHWCGGYEAIFQYTQFHTAGDDQITAGDTARLGLQVFPTLTHPAIVTTVAAAKAENSLNLNLFDLEFGRRWQQGENVTLRAFVGPRFMNLDQKYDALYTGGDVGAGGFDNVRRSLNFNGAGLRAGGEVGYKFWEFFGVYARGSAGMVVGEFRSQLKEVANRTVLVDVSEKFDKLVPMAEFGLGVSFTRGCFRLTAGYEMWNYFGGYEAIDFSDDAHPAKPNRRWSDLGFDGLVVRAEFLF